MGFSPQRKKEWNSRNSGLNGSQLFQLYLINKYLWQQRHEFQHHQE